MRHTCEFVWQRELPEEPCGLPAVDCLKDGRGNEKWLCAEHYDGQVKVDKLLLDALNWVNDKFRRGGYKRKGM